MIHYRTLLGTPPYSTAWSLTGIGIPSFKRSSIIIPQNQPFEKVYGSESQN